MTADEILKEATVGTLNIIENSPLHKAVISAMKQYHKSELTKLREINVIGRREQLIDFLDWLEANSENSVDREWIDDYLKLDKIN